MGKTNGRAPKGKAAAGARGTAKKAAKPATSKAKKKLSRPVAAPAAKAAPKPSRPSLPPTPPPAPAPPPPRDELLAPRDVARLTRYGEHFGARKIDVRWLPLQLPVSGGHLAVFDPGAPKSWRVLDRPVGNGQFRAMLSIARTDDGQERLAAVVIHVGRPPIARWTVAHYRGQPKPRSADQLPRCSVSTGWLALIDSGNEFPGVIAVPPASGVQPIEVPLTDGRKALALPCGNGEYAAYWAVDTDDRPICLVVDFDVFTQKEWKARPPA